MKATVYAAVAALAITAEAGTPQFVMYTPGGDSDLVERMDAIVSPGKISAHTHQIFGSNGASPDMTYESLQKSDCSTVGNAAMNGNSQDKSVYWHPSLYAEAADGSGYVRIPSGGHKMYYRDVGNSADKKADPFEFPKGFHMVAGDQTMRAANPDTQHQLITEWICHTSTGMVMGVDQKSGFPTDVSNCDSYPGFAGSIHYPHCWNGEDAKVNDNSHMAYPEGDPQGGPCPSTHPIRLPHIFMENFFDLAKVHDQIKPNTFVLSQGDPTGYGWHADFFNGWDEGAIPALIASCPNPFYGNEDVGTCPSFKGFSTKSTDCKLTTTYKENNDSPGQYLPGCNPITKVNPAPKMMAAALGVCSNECTPAGSSNASSGSANSAPSYKASSSAASAPKSSSSVSAPSYGKSSSSTTKAAEKATTLATTYSAPSPAAYADAAKNAVNDDVDVVWVTKMVTVTADNYKRDAAPTPAAKRHNHLHKHRRHMDNHI